MQISKEVLKFLRCPITDKGLVYDQETNTVVSCAAGLAFPIVNGIPILLKEEAIPVEPEKLHQLKNSRVESANKAKKVKDETESIADPQAELGIKTQIKQQAETVIA